MQGRRGAGAECTVLLLIMQFENTKMNFWNKSYNSVSILSVVAGDGRWKQDVNHVFYFFLLQIDANEFEILVLVCYHC